MKRILLLLSALLLLAHDAALCAAESYTLSMLPVQPPEKLTVMLTPLAVRLSTETGNSIRPLLTKNAAEYEAGLLRGGIVIGYESPMVYVNASSQHEVLATAVQGKDGAQQRGLIISRPETGIAAPEDMKGKTVLITGRSSAEGYLSQKLFLKNAGIAVERDCRLSEAAAGRGENVVIGVSLGDAEAGFVSEAAWQRAEERIKPNSVTVIMRGALLPNWALSVSRRMPEAQKEELRAILTRLPKEDAALQALGVTAFKAAEDADYDIIRHLAE
jgi:phosphonate transport system substrate-binding protein